MTELADETGTIQVYVETSRYVVVSCTPELDGLFTEQTFEGQNAWSKARAYAKEEARRLGVDWCANDPRF